MSGQIQCLHLEMYSAALVAIQRHKGDVCSQSNQIKYVFSHILMTPKPKWSVDSV